MSSEALSGSGMDRAQTTLWAEALMVIKFDEKHGQLVECMYPQNSLPEGMLEDIRMLSMPDCLEPGSNHEFQYLVRVRDKCEGGREGFVNCFIAFRQCKDSLSRRGYFQRSVVIVSKLPFSSLYFNVLERLSSMLIELTTDSRSASRMKADNPVDALNVDDAIGSIEDRNGRGSESAGNTSGVRLDQSVLEMTLESAYHTFAQWPKPSGGNLLELPFFGLIYKFLVPHMPAYYDPELSGAENKSIGQLLKKAGLETGSGLFLSTNLVSVFGRLGLVPHLWTLWECVVTGKDIVVFSPCAAVCSSAVMALASLLTPLTFGGDFRPYINPYDTDVNLLTKACNLNRKNGGDYVNADYSIGLFENEFADCVDRSPAGKRGGAATDNAAGNGDDFSLLLKLLQDPFNMLSLMESEHNDSEARRERAVSDLVFSPSRRTSIDSRQSVLASFSTDSQDSPRPPVFDSVGASYLSSLRIVDSPSNMPKSLVGRKSMSNSLNTSLHSCTSNTSNTTSIANATNSAPSSQSNSHTNSPNRQLADTTSTSIARATLLEGTEAEKVEKVQPPHSGIESTALSASEEFTRGSLGGSPASPEKFDEIKGSLKIDTSAPPSPAKPMPMKISPMLDKKKMTQLSDKGTTNSDTHTNRTRKSKDQRPKYKKRAPPTLLLGITNPFLLRSFSNAHCVVFLPNPDQQVGESPRNSSRTHGIPKGYNKRSSGAATSSDVSDSSALSSTRNSFASEGSAASADDMANRSSTSSWLKYIGISTAVDEQSPPPSSSGFGQGDTSLQGVSPSMNKKSMSRQGSSLADGMYTPTASVMSPLGVEVSNVWGSSANSRRRKKRTAKERYADTAFHTHMRVLSGSEAFESVYDDWVGNGGTGVEKKRHGLLCIRSAPNVAADKDIIKTLHFLSTNNISISGSGSVPDTSSAGAPGNRASFANGDGRRSGGISVKLPLSAHPALKRVNSGMSEVDCSLNALDDMYSITGNMLLREHFKTLTMGIMRPFECFFTPASSAEDTVTAASTSGKQQAYTSASTASSMGYSTSSTVSTGTGDATAAISGATAIPAVARAGASSMLLYNNPRMLLGRVDIPRALDRFAMKADARGEVSLPKCLKQVDWRTLMMQFAFSGTFRSWAAWRRDLLAVQLVVEASEACRDLTTDELIAAFAVEQGSSMLTDSQLRTLMRRIRATMASLGSINQHFYYKDGNLNLSPSRDRIVRSSSAESSAGSSAESSAESSACLSPDKKKRSGVDNASDVGGDDIDAACTDALRSQDDFVMNGDTSPELADIHMPARPYKAEVSVASVGRSSAGGQNNQASTELQSVSKPGTSTVSTSYSTDLQATSLRAGLTKPHSPTLSPTHARSPRIQKDNAIAMPNAETTAGSAARSTSPKELIEIMGGHLDAINTNIIKNGNKSGLSQSLHSHTSSKKNVDGPIAAPSNTSTNKSNTISNAINTSSGTLSSLQSGSSATSTSEGFHTARESSQTPRESLRGRSRSPTRVSVGGRSSRGAASASCSPTRRHPSEYTTDYLTNMDDDNEV